jgi:hypothetical protein
MGNKEAPASKGAVVQSNARNMAHTTYRANVNRRILDGGAVPLKSAKRRSALCNGAAFVDEKGGPKRPPYAALPPNTR